MTVVLGVLLALALIGLIVVVLRQNRPAPTDTTPALTAADISNTVKTEIAAAMKALSDQAREDRDESVRIAADTVAKTGAAAFGEKAENINSTLDAYRKGFETQLGELRQELATLRETNAKNYGNVDTAVGNLAREAQALNKVLSSAQGRGNWGERMLEDILSQSGFKRGINYERQETLEDGGRPDYSFFLPPDRVLYLDSKFPLDNYVKYYEATDDQQRVAYQDAFIKNVEQRVKELEKRDYVSQSNRQALDYVLLFIPNESILGFIQQAKPSLIDDATSRRVVLCSPLTLYAFLGVVRQATTSFQMEQNANQVLSLLNSFGKSWKSYANQIDLIGKAFGRIVKNFDKVAMGSKIFKALSKNIDQVEDLVREKGITTNSDATAEFEQALRALESGDDGADEDAD